MNLSTAQKMLKLLEESQADSPQDDAYYILQRMLKREIHILGGAPYLTTPKAPVVQGNYAEPTHDEIMTWESGDKVRAIKMYRDRTGYGLYDSKKAMEEFGDLRMLRRRTYVNGVTSCG